MNATDLQDLPLLALAQLVLREEPDVVDGPGPEAGQRRVRQRPGQDVLLPVGEPPL